MTSGEKFGAFIITLLILLAVAGITELVRYNQHADSVFVTQCNKAGGVAVISGESNKCYQGDHLLYSDQH